MKDTSQHSVLPRGLTASVFWISLASLSLEVLQMRIFAFTLWHHLAFLVISIAILGFGAAGAVLSSARRLREAAVGPSIRIAALLFAASAVLGPGVLAREAVDVWNTQSWSDLLKVGLYYVVFALPYFFAGWIVALSFHKASEHVGKLYFANLVGSGLGCFVLFGTITPLGAEGSLYVIAALAALAAVSAPGGRVWKYASGVVLLGFAGLAFWASSQDGTLWIRFRPADTKYIVSFRKEIERAVAPILAEHPEKRSEFVDITRWTPLGRIDFLTDLSVGGACLFQDGDAPGQLPNKHHSFPEGQIHAISYAVREKPNVLIIGIGGGLDIKIAQDNQAAHVTAVEINAETLELYNSHPQLERISGDPQANDPHNYVLEAAEGRHFVRKSDKKYDVIQMSGVDTYTALASGAYVLSESYLYTREAFRDYLDHLTDDGLFTIIRFAFPAPRETLRIMAIALDVLRDYGAEAPWQHVAVLRNPSKDPRATRLGAILVKKTPFATEELDRLRVWHDEFGYTKDYLPDETGTNPFHDYARSFAKGEEERFYRDYPYNVRPVTDDRPFFFSQHYARDVWSSVFSDEIKAEVPKNRPWMALSEAFQKEAIGLKLLFVTLLQLAVLVALCIFVPLLFLRRSGTTQNFTWAPMGYFLCLGLAYIFLMISAMQRFGLILGHPTYSVSVVMATFLIGSGLGSLVSGHVPLRRAPWLVVAVAAVLLAGALLLQLYLPQISAEVLSEPFPIRVLVTIGLLAPMAFMMGMCFPTGIRILGQGHAAMIPWAYGVNGAASVLGSVLTVVLAMNLGFTNVQWVSTGLYICAAALIFVMAAAPRRSPL